MPSSKAALTAEIRALHQQCGALEAIIQMQNAAMDEMGRLIDRMPGGLVASLKAILERHGVKFQPDRPGLQ